MPSLQIRNLPVEVYQKLKTLANDERRSLSQQAIISLSKGLGLTIDHKKRRLKVLKRIEKEKESWADLRDIDIVELVRNGRDR